MELTNYEPEKDFEKLYAFYSDEENLAKISFPMIIRDKHEFEEFLQAKLRSTWREFRILQTSKGERVGFAFSHDHGVNHCYLSCGIFPEYQNCGYGAVLGMMMVDFLFRNYPIEHVFENVFSFNRESLMLHRQSGVAKELGVLPKIRFFSGQYHDMHFFGISRKAYTEFKAEERLHYGNK